MNPIFGIERYRFGLAAGGIVLRDDSVLLVHNFEEDGDDFWVLPGGGVEEGESVDETAEREVREETGLEVKATKLIYVEQFVEDAGQTAKLWFLCMETRRLEIVVGNADHEPITEAQFLTKQEMMGRTIYPDILKQQFWNDRDAGFPDTLVIPPLDFRT